jgi:hypothetical protein|tara:strand:- start:46 stop:486 length:441 start_codon:yes stop_codon:yes gene_type:complete
MIEVKYNIDFSKALKELEEKKLSETLNEEVTPKTVELSKKFIKAGNVKPKLSGFQRNYRKSIGINQNKPLFMTGKLVNSLKGSAQGIKGVNYAKEHREGYQFERGDVPAREFVTAVLPSEKTSTNKIYKEFQKKFVTLLNKRIRKK